MRRVHLLEKPQTPQVRARRFYPDGPHRDTDFLRGVRRPSITPMSKFAASTVPERTWAVPEQLPAGHCNLRSDTLLLPPLQTQNEKHAVMSGCPVCAAKLSVDHIHTGFMQQTLITRICTGITGVGPSQKTSQEMRRATRSTVECARHYGLLLAHD